MIESVRKIWLHVVEVSIEYLYKVMEDPYIFTTVYEFSILREACICPVTSAHTPAIIDDPGFDMSEAVVMIVCVSKRYTRRSQSIYSRIIDPWSHIDIPFEDDSYIDSASLRRKDSFECSFFCPGIDLDPDARLRCIYSIYKSHGDFLIRKCRECS